MSRVWSPPWPLPEDVVTRAAAVRMLIFDVDGVLTDGSVTYGAGGEEYKTFHIRDGQGIKCLLEAGLDAALVSARSSAALSARAAELGVPHVETGVADKPAAFRDLIRRCGLSAAQCGYVGDDLVDIPVMLRCGFAVAVADAHFTVRSVAHWVTPSPGGRGAAREACDAVLYAQQKFDAIIDRHMTLSA